jgi:hypothetical protein
MKYSFLALSSAVCKGNQQCFHCFDVTPVLFVCILKCRIKTRDLNNNFIAIAVGNFTCFAFNCELLRRFQWLELNFKRLFIPYTSKRKNYFDYN